VCLGARPNVAMYVGLQMANVSYAARMVGTLDFVYLGKVLRYS
jgi:hypothetical protein